jgi:hypothetical protein
MVSANSSKKVCSAEAIKFEPGALNAPIVI